MPSHVFLNFENESSEEELYSYLPVYFNSTKQEIANYDSYACKRQLTNYCPRIRLKRKNEQSCGNG